MRLLCLILAAMLPALTAVGHTVPTLVLESEFTSGRQCTLSVNVDPRLFLSEQPTSLPPVAASWFLEQDETSKKKTAEQASGYLINSLHLTVGETDLKPEWKITAIDSANATPLATTSAEVHLLAQWTGPIPAVPGDFKAALDQKCAVSLIVLNGTEGHKDRRPQVIFPGETSRGYALPELAKVEAAASPMPAAKQNAAAVVAQKPVGKDSGREHLPYDHLALVIALAMTLSSRPGAAILLLAAFHLTNTLALAAAVAGWLPSAPGWMKAAYWVTLLVALGALISPSKPRALAVAALLAAGLAHGLNVPHLHLSEGTLTSASAAAWSALTMFVRQSLNLLLCMGALALARRFGIAGKRESSVTV